MKHKARLDRMEGLILFPGQDIRLSLGWKCKGKNGKKRSCAYRGEPWLAIIHLDRPGIMHSHRTSQETAVVYVETPLPARSLRGIGSSQARRRL